MAATSSSKHLEARIKCQALRQLVHFIISLFWWVIFKPLRLLTFSIFAAEAFWLLFPHVPPAPGHCSQDSRALSSPYRRGWATDSRWRACCAPKSAAVSDYKGPKSCHCYDDAPWYCRLRSSRTSETKTSTYLSNMMILHSIPYLRLNMLDPTRTLLHTYNRHDDDDDDDDDHHTKFRHPLWTKCWLR